ncbi:DUF72 domain-containing protein [Novosphingobium sp. P6W]|jgi:uncharacterized protein YecE (DUF72 family)|uniref:DUF72 domain-containing protein n=1 Tax=Novosphingobium sp. P6W TaxID=1609758 RepID=UPI0005C2F1CE|nr:DUF72 domain-containing protein [Novosphingobium sp. P6W]AXB75788.1 DUF72 domain-containing protein [Novosphingobium sp. P6W]KIS33003.1 hypothetical protein TQ38_05865 [Novosphingobium sp. P6W]
MSAHIGIGGWTYEPWRGLFYPKGLAQARELAYVGEHLTATEINATFYGRQKPASFAKWRDAVPDGFVFALKGSRYCTNRKNLGEAGESVANFLGQGLVELGDRLGPINWQLAATKKFDADEIAAFLALLPAAHEGIALRHAIEARHESFDDPAFYALLGKAGVAVILADSPKYAVLDAADTAPFVYLRLQDARAELEQGYDDAALDHWASRIGGWSEQGRDVFAFFINRAKERAPAAAQALIGRLADV